MQVAVGSLNPVKLQAVELAFQKVWPEKQWKIQGYPVDSGVPAQPLTDIETIAGARQRALQALKLSQAHFGVGLEGGLQRLGQHWFGCGWMAVAAKDGRMGLGSTARIIIPPVMMRLIKNGQELGEVVDSFFQAQNAKQAAGHFGLMTNQAITRTSGYTDGVIMALVRFLQPHLFEAVTANNP